VAHFLPVKETITASQLADLYVSRIDNLELAQAARELSDAYKNIAMDTEPKSRQLLETFLNLTFRSAGEPQSQAKIKTMVDEIFSNASRSDGRALSVSAPRKDSASSAATGKSQAALHTNGKVK
jgi:hypothetical protein